MGELKISKKTSCAQGRNEQICVVAFYAGSTPLGMRWLACCLLVGLFGGGAAQDDKLQVHDNSPGFCNFAPNSRTHEILYGEGGC